MSQLIYLACPYSHDNPAVRESRFVESSKAAAAMIAAGHLVLSPISHSHPIAEYGNLELGWERWEKLDKELIRRCDAVWVLMLDGWDQSKGIAAEVEYAHAIGKPVKYVKWDGIKFYRGPARASK